MSFNGHPPVASSSPADSTIKSESELWEDATLLKGSTVELNTKNLWMENALLKAEVKRLQERVARLSGEYSNIDEVDLHALKACDSFNKLHEKGIEAKKIRQHEKNFAHKYGIEMWGAPTEAMKLSAKEGIEWRIKGVCDSEENDTHWAVVPPPGLQDSVALSHAEDTNLTPEKMSSLSLSPKTNTGPYMRPLSPAFKVANAVPKAGAESEVNGTVPVDRVDTDYISRNGIVRNEILARDESTILDASSVDQSNDNSNLNGSNQREVDTCHFCLQKEKRKSLEQAVGNFEGTAANDDQLRACFFGQQLADEPVESPGEQFSWLLTVALPNPAKIPPSRGITRGKALQIFSLCFNGEELRDASTKQTERFAKERDLFMEVFDTLPNAHGGFGTEQFGLGSSGKCYGGSPMGMKADGKPSSFIELIHKTLVTKIVLHCGLYVRTTASEDDELVLLLITCKLNDVLFEADRQLLPTELNCHVVDPASLEPCTRTFYPLLHWFFRYHPVPAGDPLIAAYKDVLNSFDYASEDDKRRYMTEIAFWESVKQDVQAIDPEWFAAVDIEAGTERPAGSSRKSARGVKGNVLQSLGYTSLQAGMKDLGYGAAYLHEGFNERMDIFGEDHGNVFDPKTHIGRSKDAETEVYDMFLEYLHLRAKTGLGHGAICARDEVNEKFKSTRRRLCNLYDVLGLGDKTGRFNAYRPFSVRTYLGPGAKPWEWRNFNVPSRTPGGFILSPFRNSQVIKLVKGIIDRQVDISQLLAHCVILSFFPLDSREKLIDPRLQVDSRTGDSACPPLARCWSVSEELSFSRKALAFLQTIVMMPPPDDIRHYYGETVALYFTFVQTLVKWLVIPCVVGLIAFAVQAYKPHDSAHPLRVVCDLGYALSISLWGSAVLEEWKRHESIYAAGWGQRNTETRMGGVMRPTFRGYARRSPIDYDDFDQDFPKGCNKFGRFGRLPRKILSFACLVILAIVQIALTVAICYGRGVWALRDDWPLSSQAERITGVLCSLQMAVFGKFGGFISRVFNNWENYKMTQEYVNNLSAKVFIFEFVNRFNVFFYIAFIKAFTEGCLEDDPDTGKLYFVPPSKKRGWMILQDDAKMCQHELRQQLQVVFIMEVLKSLAELLVPWFRLILIRMKMSVAAGEGMVDENTGFAKMSHFLQHALEKPSYGELEVDGTFDDYLTIVTIFGHVTLFSSVFPLTPAMSLLLLLLEMRVDGLKLFHLVRRPLPRDAETIGMWQLILQFIAAVAVITNTALLVWTFGAFDSPFFTYYPRTRYFLSLIILLVIFKSCLALLVPKVPSRVLIVEEHHDYIRSLLESDEIKFLKKNLPQKHLDLSVQGMNSGMMHDPFEFGLSPIAVKGRIAEIKSNMSRKLLEKPGIRKLLSKIA